MLRLRQFLKSRTKTEYVFAVALLLVAVWFLSNLQGGLLHDEVRYASTGYYFFTEGKLLDVGVTNNPPLIKYFIGLSQVLLGSRDSFAIRLPSAIFALLILNLVYQIGKEKWSPLVGICSAVMLFTTYGFASRAVLGTLDMGFTFFVVLTCFVLIKFKAKRYYHLLLGTVSGCVFASKFIGVYVLIPIGGYILYSGYTRRNWKAILLFFLGLTSSVFIIYLPYLPHIDVVINSMLSTAGKSVRGGANYGIWTGILFFLKELNIYNPLYALGALSSVLWLMLGKDHDKKALALIGLSHYAGIHLMQQIGFRFILTLLPVFALFSFGFIENIASRLKLGNLRYSKLPAGTLKAVFVITLVIILVSPFGLLNWRPLTVKSLQRINFDTKADQLAMLIANYSYFSGRSVVRVVTQRQPSLLYYFGADPMTYIQSPHSPNPPLDVYKANVMVGNALIDADFGNCSSVIMYWIGFNRSVDIQIYHYLAKGKVDILILHSFKKLKKTAVNRKIVTYLNIHCKKMEKLGSYKIYYMRGVRPSNP